MREMDIRVWRIGLPPLFLLTFSLSRTQTGAHMNLSFHTFKLGFHFALSIID